MTNRDKIVAALSILDIKPSIIAKHLKNMKPPYKNLSSRAVYCAIRGIKGRPEHVSSKSTIFCIKKALIGYTAKYHLEKLITIKEILK